MNASIDNSTTLPWRATSWRMLADTATVGGFTTAAKVAGALKVILAARLFGAGDAMDAYLIAFLLPAFFLDILAVPLDSALIPALVELRENDSKARAGVLYSGVLAVTGAVLCLAALATGLLAGLILPALASSFAPPKLALTRQLLLMMLAIIPLSGLSAAWRAVLNSEHRFAYAAAVPAITPIAAITALLAFGHEYGILALAGGTVAGGTLEALAAGIGVKLAGYPVLPRWGGLTPELRRVADQYAPLVAVALVMTGSALIDQAMAARIGAGSVAALSYGTRLVGVLITIGPTAVGTAVLPHISSGAALGQAAAMRRSLRTYALVVLAAVVPATAGLVLLSEPIVRILFQQGAFSQAATHLVAAVQRASLLQLPLAVLLALEIRLTSALKANRVLYRVAVLSLALTLAFDLLFMRWWGVVGIALAGVLIRFVSALYLSCKIPGLRGSAAGIPASDGLT